MDRIKESFDSLPIAACFFDKNGVVRLINRHEDFGRNALDAGHWVRTVDLPNARLIATSVHRCDEVWREPEDESSSDDGADDELE